MQVLNVALGGDLVAHIPDHYGDDVLHRHPARRPVEHPVRVVPGSRLAVIFGTTALAVRSWHHQAVGRLGEGLRAVAWSPDGVIEAVEHEKHPFAIAVQWHPESGAARDVRQLGLFEALIDAAVTASAPASRARRWGTAEPSPVPRKRGTAGVR
jgi:putative glutamine amidotransferase